MGILHFNYRSGALGYYVNIAIALPTDGLTYDSAAAVPGKAVNLYTPGMRFQTVYLISGGGEDESVPFRYMPLERWACENRVMVVCPEVTNSYGLNTRYGINYMTFLEDELPVVIGTLFPASPAREDNFLLGYGMGGGVVMALALRHPERFCACMDIDGGIGMTMDTETLHRELEGDEFRTHLPALISAFPEGKDLEASPWNLQALARENQESGKLMPRFIFAAGQRGHVWARVRRDAELLEEMGYPVTWLPDPELGHSFDMFGKYIRMGLDTLLPLKRDYLYPSGSPTSRPSESSAYAVTALSPGLWQIDGGDGETMYLLEGKTQALLIDTGMENEPLLPLIRSLTEKPVMLALTHGHLDHIGRSGEFEQVYLSPLDREVFRQHTKILSHLSPDCTHHAQLEEFLRDMPESFDLGNLKLDVVALPGHTPGSVILVNHRDRSVFLGDALGSGDGAVLAVTGALSVAEYRQGLRQALSSLEALGVDNSWRFYGGHSQKMYTSRVSACNPPCLGMLTDMIDLCDSICGGTAMTEQCQSPFEPEKPAEYASLRHAELFFFQDNINA